MNPTKQIFLLHFAGGSSFSYDFLLPQLQRYEVHALELPGRGKRVSEDFVPDMQAAVDDYTRQIIRKCNGQPFVIFGHSMGASVGAHTVTQLERRNYFPDALIVSGNAGPGVGETKSRHLLDKDAFLQEIKDIGGMPTDFFDYPDLIDYFLPILRSDFKVIEQGYERKLLAFQTPIVAIMGDEEDDVADINNWQKYTHKECTSQVFKGDHFFIHTHVDEIVGIIENAFADVRGNATRKVA